MSGCPCRPSAVVLSLGTQAGLSENTVRLHHSPSASPYASHVWPRPGPHRQGACFGSRTGLLPAECITTFAGSRKRRARCAFEADTTWRGQDYAVLPCWCSASPPTLSWACILLGHSTQPLSTSRSRLEATDVLMAVMNLLIMTVPLYRCTIVTCGNLWVPAPRTIAGWSLVRTER